MNNTGDWWSFWQWPLGNPDLWLMTTVNSLINYVNIHKWNKVTWPSSNSHFSRSWLFFVAHLWIMKVGPVLGILESWCEGHASSTNQQACSILSGWVTPSFVQKIVSSCFCDSHLPNFLEEQGTMMVWMKSRIFLLSTLGCFLQVDFPSFKRQKVALIFAK